MCILLCVLSTFTKKQDTDTLHSVNVVDLVDLILIDAGTHTYPEDVFSTN